MCDLAPVRLLFRRLGMTRLLVAFCGDADGLRRLEPLARRDWRPEVLGLGSTAAYLWCPEGILDDRSFRSPDDAPPGPDKRMFGAAQMRWLEESLTSSEATFKIVAGGSQMLNPLTLFEAMGKYPAEQKELLDFLREAQLDRVGCFAYSPVDGAAANQLPGMLPEAVREERRARFMQVQQEISAARLERKVGTTQRVLPDQVGPTVAIGRTAADAPEIDGVVYVKKGRRSLEVGEFVDVAITRAEAHDLHGKLA